MALNSDFKVKDSLYVGNSACFVTQTDTPKILSAGTELFDIFLQEGEIAASCTLSNGTAIGTFSYDGSADVTVGVDATCNTTWNSAYTTTQSNSANWNEAYTWCTTNGDNVIDTVAEGNAQGRIAVTDIGNTTSQVDVNGLQTDDSPQFAGLCTTGNIAVDGTVDGRDVAADGITLDTLQSLSADQSLTFSSPSQGTLRITDADSDTTDIDLGVQTGDNPSFAGATAGNITVGTCTDNTISTSSGNLIIDTTGGTTQISDNLCVIGDISNDGTVDGRDIANDGTTLDTLRGLSAANIDTGSSPSQGTVRLTSADGSNTDIDTGLQTGDTPTFNGVTLCGLSNVVDNTILTINSSGNIGTDEVDSKIFGTDLVDGEGTSGTVPVYSNGTGTIGDSNIRIDGGEYVYVDGGLSATGTLSGDGSGLTGVTATPTFPTNGVSDLTNNSKLFVNDGTSCEVACNKHITYQNLLEDLVGVGLQSEPSGSTDEIGLKDNANFTNNTHLKWDDGNGQLTDSIASDNGTTMTIAGSATIQGDLTVEGNLTCLDTIIATTSAISVTNHGTGPALEVNQAGTNCTVAEFNDSDGGHTTIYDGGKLGVNTVAAPATTVGITGTLSASSTITAGSDLTVNGNTVLGNSSGDTVCIAACGVVFCNGLGNVIDNTVLTINGSGQIGSDEIDGKVWGTALVDGEGSTNSVPKYTNGTGTIGDSNITDSGSLVTLDSDTRIGDGNEFQTYASNGTNFTSEATFSETVHTSGTNVPTFTKTNLKQAKYEITLVNGVNVTSFEVNAVYNGTAPCGTTYAIVDAQAASQLADIEISSSGSTIDLDITSASNSTTAVIKGTALY